MTAPTRSLQRARLNYSPLQAAGYNIENAINKPLEGHVFFILPE